MNHPVEHFPRLRVPTPPAMLDALASGTAELRLELHWHPPHLLLVPESYGPGEHRTDGRLVMLPTPTDPAPAEY